MKLQFVSVYHNCMGMWYDYFHVPVHEYACICKVFSNTSTCIVLHELCDLRHGYVNLFCVVLDEYCTIFIPQN